MFALSTRNLALITVFGVTISLFEAILPTPIDKAFTFFQAMLLSLGYLLMGAPAATLISLVGGSLTAMWRAPLAPFTIGFALLFGASIDILCSVFRAKNNEGKIKQVRLIVAVAISTMITGVLGYEMTVMLDLMPMNPSLGSLILVSGITSGIVGAYLSLVLWKRISKKTWLIKD
jgi:uncharacterized membrane protein